MKTYEYEKIDLAKVKPYDRNARVHSSVQIEKIMQSIKEYGFTNPILIDEENNLIAGHGRLEAIKQLNKVDFKESPIKEIPCIRIEGLSESQRRSLVIADNRLAELSDWYIELLKEELGELEDMGVDLEIIGFENGVEELERQADEDFDWSGSGGSGDSVKTISDQSLALTIKMSERNYREAIEIFGEEDREEMLMRALREIKK